MKPNVVCGDHDALIAYLYGECDPEQRRAVSAHVAVCQVCAEELMALDGTREHIAQWVPPDVPLGFQMVSQADVARPAKVLTAQRWWGQPLPAWAQAAAALVIFGVGLSLGALRGSTTSPRQVAAATQPATRPAASTGAVSPSDLAALEQRLRAEIAQAQLVRAPGATSPAMLERVRSMIDESEQRQQKELALRTAEMMRDFDAQRRVDLTRIERTLGQIDGTTGVEVEQQRQMLNYLMRVSQRGQ